MWLAAGVNLLLFQWFDWPDGKDYLIPRGPYGKVGDVGRGGDVIFISVIVFVLAGAFLVGRRSVKGATIALAIALAMGATVVGMIVTLRVLEPVAYRSIPLTVITATSGSVALASIWGLRKIWSLED